MPPPTERDILIVGTGTDDQLDTRWTELSEKRDLAVLAPTNASSLDCEAYACGSVSVTGTWIARLTRGASKWRIGGKSTYRNWVARDTTATWPRAANAVDGDRGVCRSEKMPNIQSLEWKEDWDE
ncbi:hypothetical protein TcWFU_008057 [Taenia crassiceps]|uniref:Uncharacterized protein n=1 Tax=Taenia crassiceps TaxID=6207 RepID=A0ABR4Q276_9CEST